MESLKSAAARKIAAFAALVAILALEFTFALILGYSILQYLAAVMDLAQLPPAPVTPAAP